MRTCSTSWMREGRASTMTEEVADAYAASASLTRTFLPPNALSVSLCSLQFCSHALSHSFALHIQFNSIWKETQFEFAIKCRVDGPGGAKIWTLLLAKLPDRGPPQLQPQSQLLPACVFVHPVL